MITTGLAFRVNMFASTGLELGWWYLPELGARGIAYATLFSVSLMALVNLAILIKRGVLMRSSFAPLK